VGLLSDYITAYTTASTEKLVNVEFVLKNIDDNNTEILTITLTDANGSEALPGTTGIVLTTVLQTIRNNLKHLFENKENTSNKKTSITDSDTDYPTTKAVKTQLDTKENTSNKKTSITDSDTDYPTTKAVKTQLDTKATKATTDEDKAKFIKGDGTFATPPNTDTVYTHPTTEGNKHIPSGGAEGNILKYSSAGTATWAVNTADNLSGFGINNSNNSAPILGGGYYYLSKSGNTISLNFGYADCGESDCSGQCCGGGSG
jgi:hypothetical protein